MYTHLTSQLSSYIDVIGARLVTNNEIFIDNLVSICQYQSALERYAKIKSEMNSTQTKLSKLTAIKDQALVATVHTINRKQMVFLIKLMNAYAIIRLLNNPNILYLEAENGVEFIGKLTHENESVDIQIYEIIQENKDISFRLGLLGQVAENSGISVQARLMFLD